MQQNSTRFVAIGHITNDIGPPDRLGGGVSYAAVAAHRLGCDAHVITKCDPDHPRLKELESFGVTVHLLPTASVAITTFRNTYDSSGKRTQHCTERQEPIGVADFPSFPHVVLQGATILAAPVAEEIDTDLLPLLAQYGRLALTPQGYFRAFNPDGTVVQQPWDLTGCKAHLRTVSTLILSDEDITFNGRMDEMFLRELRQLVPSVILTRGAHGSTLYLPHRTIDIPSFRLNNDELNDPTGLGDVYAASFLVLEAHHPRKTAACYASFYAALKLHGFGSIGVGSVPAAAQVRSFIDTHHKRVSAMLPKQSVFIPPVAARTKVNPHVR